MIITFLSDFGTEDGYVGSVKGVLLKHAPKATIVDITHNIPPFNIKRAAYALLNYYDSFPAGTVHLTVVDPGVGSARKGIILKTKNYYFVGPDNGLFTLIQNYETETAYEINRKVINPDIRSTTFHARDLFAPAAAMLANGTSPERIGIPLKGLRKQVQVFFKREGNALRLKIIAIDHFGNIITGLSKEQLKSWKKSIKSVTFKNFKTERINRFYAQKKAGEPLVLWNSLNFLEIALCEGSAAKFFNVNEKKDEVKVVITDKQ